MKFDLMCAFHKEIFLCLALPCLLIAGLAGQNPVQSDTLCTQRDLNDVVADALGRAPKEKGADEGNLMLVPIVGSNPATGFMMGLGGQSAFKLPSCSSYSSISGSAQVTTKRQMILMFKNNMSMNSDRIKLVGDWRYLKFSQSTYGLGTSAPEGGLLDYQYGLAGVSTTTDSLAQPMNFNFARLHQTVYFHLYRGIYAGAGFNFQTYFNINEPKLNLGPSENLITSHYLYNLFYGFDTEAYTYSAFKLSLVYDTRDNVMNPYRGMYVKAALRAAYVFLGNHPRNYTFQGEYRSYHGLSTRNPSHLLAFWVMGEFSKNGKLPYMVLPATAYDQIGRSGRGYTQGRGLILVYGEAEYRFPPTCNGLLGGVVFANMTTSNNPMLEVDLLDVLRAGYGAGLRVKIDKRTRMNLAIDVAFGHRSFGFYLAVTEAF